MRGYCSRQPGQRTAMKVSWALASLPRRVRNIYYDKSFAEVLYRELVLHHANVKTVWGRLHLRCIESGNELRQLIPHAHAALVGNSGRCFFIRGRPQLIGKPAAEFRSCFWVYIHLHWCDIEGGRVPCALKVKATSEPAQFSSAKECLLRRWWGTPESISSGTNRGSTCNQAHQRGRCQWNSPLSAAIIVNVKLLASTVPDEWFTIRQALDGSTASLSELERFGFGSRALSNCVWARVVAQTHARIQTHAELVEQSHPTWLKRGMLSWGSLFDGQNCYPLTRQEENLWR